jgi:hypothetical protein
MERVQVLIDKLAEQKARNDNAAQMLITVQLLQNELLKLNEKNVSIGTSKVSVIMPVSVMNQAGSNEKAENIKQPKQEKLTGVQAVDVPKPRIEIIKSLEPVTFEHLENKTVESLKEPITPQKTIIETRRAKEEKQKIPASHLTYLPFDAMAETPTLLQQTLPKELHEAIGSKNESLNDKLKDEKRELAHKLKDAPIKDLRKGIGINDKFSFVSELFRGDEDMYERSIKTINSFHILPEAEYWMNRELKVKLGWNDNKELVQHFYQLVRRRFS